MSILDIRELLSTNMKMVVAEIAQAEASTAMKMAKTMMMTMTVRPRLSNPVIEAGECLNLMKMTK